MTPNILELIFPWAGFVICTLFLIGLAIGIGLSGYKVNHADSDQGVLLFTCCVGVVTVLIMSWGVLGHLGDLLHAPRLPLDILSRVLILPCSCLALLLMWDQRDRLTDSGYFPPTLSLPIWAPITTALVSLGCTAHSFWFDPRFPLWVYWFICLGSSLWAGLFATTSLIEEHQLVATPEAPPHLPDLYS